MKFLCIEITIFLINIKAVLKGQLIMAILLIGWPTIQRMSYGNVLKYSFKGTKKSLIRVAGRWEKILVSRMFFAKRDKSTYKADAEYLLENKKQHPHNIHVKMLKDVTSFFPLTGNKQLVIIFTFQAIQEIMLLPHPDPFPFPHIKGSNISLCPY